MIPSSVFIIVSLFPRWSVTSTSVWLSDSIPANERPWLVTAWPIRGLAQCQPLLTIIMDEPSWTPPLRCSNRVCIFKDRVNFLITAIFYTPYSVIMITPSRFSNNRCSIIKIISFVSNSRGLWLNQPRRKEICRASRVRGLCGLGTRAR